VSSLSWVFFGSGSFAKILLEQFSKIGFLPHKVVTSPPKRKGRGLKLKRNEVAILAERFNLEVNEVNNPNEESFLCELRNYGPDFIVVSDYGKILKTDLLALPKRAPFNVHPSLLPRYRGAAPIERAIMKGERELGVTVFMMDEGIDTGPLLIQDTLEIKGEETKGDILPRLASMGARLLKEAMVGFTSGKIKPVPQPEEGVSYAKKITKEELWIDFNKSAGEVLNQIRALSPEPGARTFLDGMFVKILRARVREESGTPGEILPGADLLIACLRGTIEVIELIPEGKRVMTGRDFKRGHPNLRKARSFQSG